MDEWIDKWMDGQMDVLVSWRAELCVCDLNTALYFAYLQFNSSDGPIVEVPLSPPCGP